MLPYVIGAVVAVVISIPLGIAIGIAYRKKIAEAAIGSAEEKAKNIVNDAIKTAETKSKEALLEAKEDIHRSRTEAERKSGTAAASCREWKNVWFRRKRCWISGKLPS